MKRSWQIGDVRVTRVVEIEGPTNPRFLYRDMTPEALERHHSWLKPHFVADNGLPLMAVQTFLVESGGLRIVVDTCIGNDKKRQMDAWNELDLPFLERLAEAGCRPEDIDLVLCTHLHVDHVGWNTRLEEGRWVPTFTRARYLFGREEWLAWKETDQVASGFEHFGDSVLPLIEAGRVDLIDSDHRINDEIFLEPTPGHSPGHVSVRIESGGAEAVITGDVLHHPVQCAESAWNCSADWDSEQAVQTRREFVARHAAANRLVLGTHFATPVSGRFVEHPRDEWRFRADDSVNSQAAGETVEWGDD